jgi:UDP-glucuronate 4-epimerase
METVNRKIIVTSSARFIGSALALRLLKGGDTVIGIGNHNNYYAPAPKEANLALHAKHPDHAPFSIDLFDRQATQDVFKTHQPQRMVNLAAQAGVRIPLATRSACMPLARN